MTSCAPALTNPELVMAGESALLALNYARAGWSLLPIARGSKRPNNHALAAVHGTVSWRSFIDRAASEEQVRSWFRADPTTGVAVITGTLSGLVVVDYDSGPAPELPTPSVVTPRGRHLYFASDSPPKLRRHAHGEVRGDGGYVLLPPSIHPTGVAYQWLEGKSPTEIPLMPFEEVAHLWPPSKEPPSTRDEDVPLPPAPAGAVPVVRLEPAFADYVSTRPGKSSRLAFGIDGSAYEYGIACELVKAGCSDEQIRVYFDHHALPRHSAERHKHGYAWLDRTIEQARRAVLLGPLPSTPPTCVVDEPFSLQARAYVQPDLHVVLELVSGQQVGAWVAAVVAETGCSQSTAKRIRRRLEQKGYITTESVNGRAKRVHLTRKGQIHLEPTKSGFRRTIFL